MKSNMNLSNCKKLTKKITLPESDMPLQWYNIMADMRHKPAPLLNPQTRKPLQASDMEPLFAHELVKQEFSVERYVDIPHEVRELYKIYRPDRKSTRLNSSHQIISYAVFCL